VSLSGCASRHAARPDLAADPVRAAPPPLRAIDARTDAGSLERLDAGLASAWRDVRANPTAAAHRTLADAYLRLGVLDSAIDQYDMALRLDPKCAAAYDGRARAFRDLRLPGFALGDAYRAVYYGPRSAAALNTLGSVLGALGRRVDAGAAFRRALVVDPGAADALSNLSALAFGDGDVAVAEALGRQAVVANPALRGARAALALALARAASVEALRETLAPVETGAGAEYAIGQVLAANGRFTEAADAFARAARMDPAFARARDDARLARARARTAGD